MRWVLASDDLVSNLGVSAMFFGLLLLLGELKYDGLLTSGLVMLVTGAVLYFIRNKDEAEH